MPTDPRPSITFTRIYPTGSSSVVTKSPFQVVDQSAQGLVSFVWNSPLDLFDIAQYLNPRVSQENQQRPSSGDWFVWSPDSIVAVSVLVHQVTMFKNLGDVTYKGVLIDPDGLIYQRATTQRTLVLLLADYISDPAIYAAETGHRVAL